jgi:hypothetical protein
MRVEMARAARQELVEAKEHYDEKRAGLGDEFLEEFAAAVEYIRAWPGAAPRVSRRARRRQMKRFPYGIIYEVREDRLRIVAVMHLSRRPGYWKDRE